MKPASASRPDAWQGFLVWCRLTVLACCLAPQAGAQILEETGTLRGFLAGDCPGCAYDNWISHVTEAVARPGYNAYAPALLDPQTNGFGGWLAPPSSGALADSLGAIFREAPGLLLEDRGAELAARLAAQPEMGYELVHLADSSLGRSFWILREPLDRSHVDPGLSPGPQDDVVGGFARGWGVFIVDPAARRPDLCLQMPHPCDDFPTPHLGLEAFLELEAGLLMIHGASREKLFSGATYTNSASLSDPTRHCGLPFALFHAGSVLHARATGRRQLVVQLHSYDDLAHRDLKDWVLGAGPADRYPNVPLFDTGGSAKGLLGNLPQPIHAAGALGWAHPEVRLQDHISTNSLVPLWLEPLPDSTLLVPSAGVLPGYGANCQLSFSQNGNVACKDAETILHFELDELPAVAHGMGAAAFYGCGPDTLVATQANFALAWSYWRPLFTALGLAMDSLAAFVDDQPPTAPTDLAAGWQNNQLQLSWTPALSTWFDHYLVVVDTTAGLASAGRRTSTPCYVGTRSTALAGFGEGRDQWIGLLAVDAQGRQAACADTVLLHVPDTQAPVLVVEERRLAAPGEAILLRASVQDVSPIDVWLEWSPDSLGWSALPMVQALDGAWEVELPAHDAGDSLWYRVRAEDFPQRNHLAVSSALRVDILPRLARLDFDLEDAATHARMGSDLDSWARETCAVQDGRAWRFGGDGCGSYPANGGAWLEFAPIALPAGLGRPVLALWAKMDAEVSTSWPDSCYDGGVLEWRPAGGEWREAETLPAPEHARCRAAHVELPWPRRMYSGARGWTQLLLELPEGLDSVQLRAGFVSDGGTQRSGWVLDELELHGVPGGMAPPQLRILEQGGLIHLAWERVPGASGYRVESRSVDQVAWVPVAQTADPSWEIEIPASGGLVCLRVVACFPDAARRGGPVPPHPTPRKHGGADVFTPLD